MPVKLEDDVYTLDDGTTVTIKELAMKLRCSDAGARNRLNKYSNPKAVFAPMGKIPKRLKKVKKYMMADGIKYTIAELSSLTGINPKTIRHRVYAGWDTIERLSVSPQTVKTKEFREANANQQLERIAESIRSRNYFDEMSRLALRAI